MRYTATFLPYKQPQLNGRTVPFGEDAAGTSCHVFKAGDVKVTCARDNYKEFDVTLVAGELVKSDRLYGPASLRDRTLIYPCEEFKCRLGCPCQMCRQKLKFCEDFVDHLTFHRASHRMGKFCNNIDSYIDNFAYNVF